MNWEENWMELNPKLLTCDRLFNKEKNQRPMSLGLIPYRDIHNVYNGLGHT